MHLAPRRDLAATIAMLTTAAVLQSAVAGCAKNPSPVLEPPVTQEHSESAALVQLTRQKIQSERDAIVTAALPLTAEQSTRFWPLYREYRGEVQKLNDRTVGILGYYGRVGGKLNDAEANEMLAEYLRIEKERVETQQKYVEKFREVLPPVQVAQFFQLENKMDAVVAYDLAGAVPLIAKLSP